MCEAIGLLFAVLKSCNEWREEKGEKKVDIRFPEKPNFYIFSSAQSNYSNG